MSALAAVAGDTDRLPINVLFSEVGIDWRPISYWAEFLIQFGHSWPASAPGRRRIALISMPSDSAAAGLIALGALVRDLASDSATNVTGHYDALLRHARQYIKNCRDCDMRCQPESKRCGYFSEATGLVRDKNNKAYRISEATDFKNKQLVLSIDRGTWTVWPKRALDLQIDGHPRPRLINAAGALPADAYASIVTGAKICPKTIRESYSGLCFAGRSAGEAASRKACASIRFRCNDIDYDLPELLTIQGWAPSSSVSRMSFFNARTEVADTNAISPALVIADGDSSFLKVLARTEFQQSDVIGVFHRTIDRDSLELLGNRMIGLRQWYTEDSASINQTQAAPRGIEALILSRRAG
jgi:hypothetical protein